METLKEQKEFLKDLLKAQKKVTTLTKDSKNPFFKKGYASLKQIMEHLKPICNENNIIIIQQVSSKLVENKLMAVVTTTLQHVTGEKLETKMMIVPDKQGAQALGSAISYAKRYSLGALLGVVSSEEDDDGEATMDRNNKTIPKPKKAVIKPKPIVEEPFPKCEALMCPKCNVVEPITEGVTLEKFEVKHNKSGILFGKCKGCGEKGKIKEFVMEV